MFVVSKRNFKFRFPDGSEFRLEKDHMGDIPDHIAEHPLFKAAVQSGWIVTPAFHADAAIYKADEIAKQREQASDIRSDAPKPEPAAEGAEKTKKAPSRQRAKK